MPFYDYKCDRCGKTFEALHGMGAKPEGLKCGFCDSPAVQRIFRPVGMIRAGNDFSSVPASSAGKCFSCSSGSCGTCH